MPDPPRRILEKSRTVRRRYQRSNKGFQFTASQIERIEREEERERRAQKLREKEKRRIANRKKKAEKEAREREERRRLGLPDPNVKVPASQPRLLNFLERKKEEQQQERQTELSEKESHQQEDTEVETEAEDWFDGDGDEDHSQGDAQAGDSNGKVSAVITLGQDSRRATPPTMMVTDCDGNVNEHSASDSFIDPGESFQDETAILLEDLDPDTLQLSGQTQNEHLETDVSCVQTQSEASLTSRSTCEPISQPDSTCCSTKGDCSKITPKMASPSHNKMSPKPAESEPFIIYQDPDDVVAQISTQDLLEVDDGKDDYKENWHPNIPYGPRQWQQPNDVTPRRRPKPYSELQTRAERQPLMTLSQAPDTEMDGMSKKKSPCTTRSRRGSSPTPIGRKKQIVGNADTTATRVSPTKKCPVANEDDDEDEFGEFDLTMEELEALCA